MPNIDTEMLQNVNAVGIVPMALFSINCSPLTFPAVMFETAATQSTFVWTLLLLIGLFFFIRASAKDRIETAQLLSTQPESELRDRLREYFATRAYRVINRDADNDKVTLEGFVAPSKFLAGLLSALAGVGGLCLGLVISLAVPEAGYLPLGLVAIAPAAGFFYWKTSGRIEQVVLRVEMLDGETPIATEAGVATGRIIIKAHRDEVEALRLALELEDDEAAYAEAAA